MLEFKSIIVYINIKNILGSFKTIIFGDSYSTFEDYIPIGFAFYYSGKGRGETDVTAVGQTWWHQVVNETELNLVQNISWSGSTICYTGYERY